MLSTSSAIVLVEITRHNETRKIPKIAADYNKGIGGGVFGVVVVVVVDLPLLRVAVEGSDNPVSLEKPCQASLPPDQQGRHSLGRQPEVQYVA